MKKKTKRNLKITTTKNKIQKTEQQKHKTTTYKWIIEYNLTKAKRIQ